MKISKLAFFVFVIVSTHGVTTAQTTKGDVLMQGNFSYISTDEQYNPQENEANKQLLINCRVGFYTNKNFVIGFGLGYNNTDVSGLSYVDPSLSYRYFYEEKVVNYYLYTAFQKALSSKLKTNISVDFSLGRGNYNEKFNLLRVNGRVEPQSADVRSTSFMIRPGIFYFLNERWILNINYAQIGLKRYIYEFENNELENEELRANFNPETLSFGLAFLFSKKKES